MKKTLIALPLLFLSTFSNAETFCDNIAGFAETAVFWRYTSDNTEQKTVDAFNGLMDKFKGRFSKTEINNFKTYIKVVVEDAYNQPDFEGHKYEFIQSFKNKWLEQCIKENS